MKRYPDKNKAHEIVVRHVVRMKVIRGIGRSRIGNVVRRSKKK